VEKACSITGSGPLFEDKTEAAYHLALLGKPYSQHVSWYFHRDAYGQADGAVALYDMNRPTIIFLLGKDEAVSECLAYADLPDLAYAAYFPGHASIVSEFYRVLRPVEMLRMVLKRDEFESSSRKLARRRMPSDGRIVLLGPKHLEMLRELYSSEPGFLPDPYQYAAGGYLGIFGEGRLLAATGTHFVSEEHSFAMIGNVLTRPGYRRAGLATRIVLDQLGRLFERVETVCLNVDTGNSSAVKMYESLGFTAHCSYYEGIGVLRKVAANAL